MVNIALASLVVFCGDHLTLTGDDWSVMILPYCGMQSVWLVYVTEASVALEGHYLHLF